MKIHIRSRHAKLTDELREVIIRRIHFALGRFSPKITQVTVVLCDVNGPRGGVDQCCRVAVNLQHGGQLMIKDADASLATAIACAIGRTARRVRRELDRRRNQWGRPADRVGPKPEPE